MSLEENMEELLNIDALDDVLVDAGDDFGFNEGISYL